MSSSKGTNPDAKDGANLEVFIVKPTQHYGPEIGTMNAFQKCKIAMRQNVVEDMDLTCKRPDLSSSHHHLIHREKTEAIWCKRSL